MVRPGLERIAAAEARAAQTYRDSVVAQLKADATPIPNAFHAGRGGCHRIGSGQEEVRASFGAASRRTKRSARNCGGSQTPCGGNSATILCAPCCGPRVGQSRWPLCRASIRPHLNRSAAPCTRSNRVSGPTLIRLRQSGSHSVRHSDTDGS